MIARVIIYEADIGEAPSKVSSHHKTDARIISVTEENRPEADAHSISKVVAFRYDGATKPLK